jgi:hypothetical protein
MIKLKDLLTEEISATEVNKLEKMSTPKMMEIEYIGIQGGKEKRKYKVVDDYRSGKYRFFQLKDLKPEKNTFNNYELIVDERKLKVELSAVMGYASSTIAKKILKIKAK